MINMFTLTIRGFKNKSQLLDTANLLYNTKIDQDNLILQVLRIEHNDKAHKLGEWIIKGIDKTKELYYDVTEHGNEI